MPSKHCRDLIWEGAAHYKLDRCPNGQAMKSAAYHSQETGADREAATFNLAVPAGEAVAARCRIKLKMEIAWRAHPKIGIECCIDATGQVVLVVKVKADLCTDGHSDCIEAVLDTEVQYLLQRLEGEPLAAPVGGFKPCPVHPCEDKLVSSRK